MSDLWFGLVAAAVLSLSGGIGGTAAWLAHHAVRWIIIHRT